MLWDDLKKIPKAKWFDADSHGEMILLPVPALSWAEEPSYWLIGRYDELTELSTDLRGNKDLQQLLTDQGVRFGLRNTDRPPVTAERQERYGAVRRGADAARDFTAERTHLAPQPSRDGKEPSVNRRTDREQNVFTYWAQQTAQSHHVVEFNHLRDIDKSKDGNAGPLDHGQLPCVLLAAEFHQRYVSSALKWTHGKDKKFLEENMASVYRALYTGRCAPLHPLWEVSKTILRAAGLPVA